MVSLSVFFRPRFLLAVLIVSAGMLSPLRATPVNPASYSGPVKVACVGDSITFGMGADPGKSYPDQLQALLGPGWIVKNFGVSARTLLRKGDFPWWKETAFTASHDFRPDVVVIMLGTNDTKPVNWVHRADFYTDYRDLIESFKTLPEHPAIFICRPTPIPEPGNYGINETNLRILMKKIDRLAQAEHVNEIDVHGAMLAHPELFPDRVHPNDQGAALLARTVAQAIRG